MFILNVFLFRGVNVYVEIVKVEGFNYVIVWYYVIRNVLRSVLKVLDLILLVNDKDVFLMVIVFKFNINDEVKIIKDEFKNWFKIIIVGG